MASGMPSIVFSLPSSQDMMESAGQLIDRALQEDRMYLDLADLLRVPAHNQPNVSGLQDFDYPSLIDARVSMDTLRELSDVKRVPLPPELVEQFGRMQCRCTTGFFPEIERVWLTIDSDIFVWRFEDGRDLAYFDGLTETVLTASLAHPKPGIFQPHIQYLLCVATAVDIVLLGVSFRIPQDGSPGDLHDREMHLLPDPLFSVPTDKHMLSITSMDSGRIFLAGKDGCLYELAYQADDGWFSRKCRLINHSTGLLSYFMPSFLNFSISEEDPLVQIAVDNSRNIVYTRSEKCTIKVYDLGADGTGMCQVTAIPLESIVQHASQVARTIDRSNFKPIVHLAPVTRSESNNLHLVAVTKAGVRLYFSTTPFGHFKSRPNILALVHVRLPPGFSASASPRKPTKVHMAYHRRGSLLLASSITENEDLIWATSCDSFPFQNQLMETQTTMAIDGTTWAICELPYPPFGYAATTKDAEGGIRCDPPVVVTQHVEMSRKFVFLNSQGICIVHKMRPVDQLRQILMDKQGPDNEEVKAFFKLHKVDQACATCLLLACSKLHVDQQVGEWAKMAFFMYGGEAVYNMPTPGLPHSLDQSVFSGGALSPVYTQMTTPGNTFMIPPGAYPSGYPSAVSSPAPETIKQILAKYKMKRTVLCVAFPSRLSSLRISTPAQLPAQHAFLHGGSTFFSGKLNGICIYLGRILRPLWESYIVTEFPHQTPQGTFTYLTSSFKTAELNYVLELAGDLRHFVKCNSKFDSTLQAESASVHDTMGIPRHIMLHREGGQVDEQTGLKLQAEATKLEKCSLHSIENLLSHTCEVLGLLKVLVDHQFHILAANLPKDHQDQLRAMTFKQLVVNGKEMCGALITCLINRYLDDNATINAISSRLREICPSLYSQDDAVCSKANELLQAAKSNPNQSEKREQLKEALQLYKDVVCPLNLPAVCNSFASVRFYEGIVDLCLTAAQKHDPSNLALHFYKSGEPMEDTDGMQYYLKRRDCYACILETFGYLLSQSIAHPQAPSVPKSPGPPPAPDPDRLSNLEAEKYKEQVFRMALRSDDELFHVSLYEWLVKKNLSEQLLQIQSPFLEPFLKRRTGTQAESTAMMDMLWKYYEKTRNFPAAAKILACLAERHGNDIPLTQRLEYLSRAIICAKSSGTTVSSATEGEFLHELEEKMEVARLQMQVYDAISKLNMGLPDVVEAAKRLDSNLHDITTLYEDFADRFRLFECKLAIVQCGGLHDSALVEDLWLNIIDREFAETVGLSAASRMATINAKLVSIGRLYVNTEQYFPLAFIVRYLEQRSCEMNFDSKWTFRTMLETGVKIPVLHEIYDRLFRSKDPYWQTIKRPLHLLTVLHGLLQCYTQSPQQLQPIERRKFTAVCHDAIANYLVELQAMSSSEPGVSTLMQHFKLLQVTLDRL
ncbi:nuclear pore complex protein Nup155-like [Liolophura sinensis]|uniref:nuclear pore complex protein Nup155-like n=1 Tax=Liolophura sinensis TaxID=3198878 RepID=UPI0031592F3C